MGRALNKHNPHSSQNTLRTKHSSNKKEMFANFLTCPISTQVVMANLKSFDRVVPTFPRQIIRNARVLKVFAASYSDPYEDEIWQTLRRLSLRRNLDLLLEYNEANKKCRETKLAMVEKELAVEEDFKWFKFVFEIYISEVMPSSSRKKILNEVVTLEKIIMLTDAYKKCKEAEAVHEELKKNYREAFKTCYSLYEKYKNELAEAFLYKTNRKYYLIECMMKPNSDDEESELRMKWKSGGPSSF